MKRNSLQHCSLSPNPKPVGKGCRPGLEELESRLLASVTLPTWNKIVIDYNAATDSVERTLADLQGTAKLDIVVGYDGYSRLSRFHQPESRRKNRT